MAKIACIYAAAPPDTPNVGTLTSSGMQAS